MVALAMGQDNAAARVMDMSEQAEIGLIGLGVMGQNLALNIADHGYPIAVYNRTAARTEAFVAGEEARRMPLRGCAPLEDLIGALRPPRAIILMVQAGAVTDAQIDALAPLLGPSDVIMDGGNARFQDTIRRERVLREQGLSSSAPASPAARRGRAMAPRSWRAARPRRSRGWHRSSRRSPPRSTARPAARTSARTAPAISSR